MTLVKGYDKSVVWWLSLESEKEFWIRDRRRVCSTWWIDIRKNRAERLKEWLSQYMSLDDKSVILQIGAGPDGEINFLEVGHRFAIDPLADFFKGEFSQILDPAVDFTAGVGEELPYEDDMFDLVIIHNALDHTWDPPKVLSEIYRVLKVGGIGHIAVHTYPTMWIFPLKLFKFIQRSKDHPWRYTRDGLNRDIITNNFRVLDNKNGSEDERSLPNWLSATLYQRIARSVGLNVPMLHILVRKVKVNSYFLV